MKRTNMTGLITPTNFRDRWRRLSSWTRLRQLPGCRHNWNITRPQAVDPPVGTHAVEMVPDLCPSIFMDAYHRSMRRSLPTGHPQPNLLEATDMIAGDAYTTQLVEPGGRLDRLLKNGSSDEQVIDDFYLAALARPPQPEEKQALLSYMQRHQANRKEALANIEWAVISSREFAYN